MIAPVLSHFQARRLLDAQRAGDTNVKISLDLGLSDVDVTLDAIRVTLPDGQQLPAAALEVILANDLACYQVIRGELQRIEQFSEAYNRYYSLMPTAAAPTMLISGIPMHRIKNTDPHRDTLSKIKALGHVYGSILDTTMGLGYTAVEAARYADHVTTIELDPAVVEICRANPWSQGLFNNPKISRMLGDAFDLVNDLADASFSAIVHDPPMFSLAGHLYSAEFYQSLHRLLRPNGRLFHYVGDPDSRSGRNTTRGVLRRLKESGFRRVKSYPRAFGVVATK